MNHNKINVSLLIFFVLTVLLIFFPPFLKPCFSQNLLRIHFINVGYGDCALIQFPDSTTLMVDAGERTFSEEVLNHLRAFLVKKIDIQTGTILFMDLWNSS